MITANFKAVYEQISDTWPADAQSFCLSLLEAMEQMEGRIKALEDQLALHSGNSSRPPSQDGFKKKPPKPKSLRKSSGKKPGGQPGHQGQGAKLSDNPDEVILYGVVECPDCKVDLSEQEVDAYIRKQVEDIPPIQTIVTEHRIEIKTCPCCSTQWQGGGCPAEIQHEFQYGPRIKAISVYLSTFQFIPALRTKQLLEVFGVTLSTGTLDNFRKSASRQLQDFMERLRLAIIAATVGFFDETGMKVKGVGHWVHVAATHVFSLFAIHRQRGQKAHQDIGILPFFRGLLHRDGYHSYRSYTQATHSACCAHYLRDLIYADEQDAQGQWAQPLIKLLLQIKDQVDRNPHGVLDKRWQGRHRKKYRAFIQLGLAMNPPAVKKNGKRRGRTAQTKTVNLLVRLQEQEDEVLRFMTHPEAQFDNNQAERDLRMNKVRQKISGGFRSHSAAEEFMNIRSFVSTVIKQGGDPIEELVNLFTTGNTDYLKYTRNPE